MTCYVRTPLVDLLEVDGESIVLYENRFVRLGLLATRILACTEIPRSLEYIADSLSETFGAPSDADPLDVTHATLGDLVANDVMAEVTDDRP